MNVVAANDLRFCSEQSDLLDLLNEAVNVYCRLTDELARLVAAGPNRNFSELREEVKLARSRAQCAREMLLSHRKEHGCAF